MTRVLVVEDDPSARNLLVAILADDGYDVRALADGSAAPRGGGYLQAPPRLLDSGLPGITGAEVARRLRQTSDLLIIFVTGAHAAEDIHDAFKLGADDYIVKPFDPEELSWRVRAVLRRAGQDVAQVSESGDLLVDEGALSVTRAGAPIDLTAIEFKLLTVLVHNRSRVVSTSRLSTRCGATTPRLIYLQSI